MHFRRTNDIVPHLFPENNYEFAVKVVKGVNGHSLYSLPISVFTRDPGKLVQVMSCFLLLTSSISYFYTSNHVFKGYALKISSMNCRKPTIKNGDIFQFGSRMTISKFDLKLGLFCFSTTKREYLDLSP